MSTRPPLQTRTVKGHTGPIYSVAAGNPASELYHSTLLSGSSDGTARLWDMRAAAASATTFTPPSTEGVSSVAYSDPLTYRPLPGWGSPISAAAPHSLFIACGNTVYEYDPRFATAPLATLPAAEDDISALAPLSLRPSRPAACAEEGRIQLAVADDTGLLRVFSRPTSGEAGPSAPAWSECASWRSIHGDGLPTALAWWPSARRIISSGTDSTALFTSLPSSIPTTPATLTAAPAAAAPAATAPLTVTAHPDSSRKVGYAQPIVPAFALSLPSRGAPTGCGGLLATALYTGTILLYGVTAPNSAGGPVPPPTPLGSLLGHSYAAVGVEVPPFLASPASTPAAGAAAGAGGPGDVFPDALVSVGLDCCLVLWSGLRARMQEKWAEGASKRAAARKAARKRNKGKAEAGEGDGDGVDEETAEGEDSLPRYDSSSLAQGHYKPLREYADEFDVPLLRLRAPLPWKPNAVACDARGWAWAAGAGSELVGYNLIAQ